ASSMLTRGVLGSAESARAEKLQSSLLAAAGFTAIGGISVEACGRSGHALGIVRAPDGRTFVTSNDRFYEAHGAVQSAARQALREIYDLRDDDPLRGFTLRARR